MKKIRLNIDDMHCSSCAMNIDFDLEDIEGIKSSKTSYAKHISEVEYDELSIEPVQIIEQIKKTGYEATVISDKE